MTYYTPPPAETFLIELLDRPLTHVPRTRVAELAAAAGITPDALDAARHRLHIAWSSQGECLLRELCITCLRETVYVEPHHRLALCPACTSPIETWAWDELVAPRPGARRQRRRYVVAHRPGTWPANTPIRNYETGELITNRSKACASVFERSRSHRPMCADPVVWKVHQSTGRSRVSGTQFWCDADLPADVRPPENATKLA